MRFDLNSRLDVDAIKARFEERGWVSIPNLVPDDQAEALREHLLRREDWNLRFRDLDGRLFEFGPNEQAELGPARIEGLRKIAAPKAGKEGFGIFHSRLTIIDHDGKRVEPDSLMADFGRFLFSHDVASFVSQVTGVEGINFAMSFAARYDANDHTGVHNDGIEERVCAFVYGLTKDWRADWGGLLLFHDKKDEISAGLVPAFNTLNLFKVPRNHSVSAVSPFATAPRLSVTGWYYADNPCRFEAQAGDE